MNGRERRPGKDCNRGCHETRPTNLVPNNMSLTSQRIQLCSVLRSKLPLYEQIMQIDFVNHARQLPCQPQPFFASILPSPVPHSYWRSTELEFVEGIYSSIVTGQFRSWKACCETHCNCVVCSRSLSDRAPAARWRTVLLCLLSRLLLMIMIS
jgi:hypothetical protein